jgi:hypothetical protein
MLAVCSRNVVALPILLLPDIGVPKCAYFSFIHRYSYRWFQVLPDTKRILMIFSKMSIKLMLKKGEKD